LHDSGVSPQGEQSAQGDGQGNGKVDEAAPGAGSRSSQPADTTQGATDDASAEKTKRARDVRSSRGSRPARARADQDQAASSVRSREVKITQADELEIRLARLHYWQGAYSRRGINLQRHYDPEPLLITDLDLLAIELSAQLVPSKTIGEAKSGTGKSAPKPLDRSIWVAGLMRLVGAQRGELVTAVSPSRVVRDTAAALGVRAFGVDELARWERSHITDALADVGAHGQTAYTHAERTRIICRNQPALERVYWFLRSEVWFLGPWLATKRLLGAAQKLRKWWTPQIDDDEAAALRWLYAETTSVLTLQLVALVGEYLATSSGEWRERVADRLAEGSIPAHQMKQLATSFDSYLARVLSETDASATLKTESIGAFHPQPPPWTEPLIELIERLANVPGLGDLPRHTDLVMHERLVHRRHVSDEAVNRLGAVEAAELDRVRRVIAAFLRVCVDLPEAVHKALTT
jgi:hypothetical protein